MHLREIIDFLREHQPFPPDDEMRDEDAERLYHCLVALGDDKPPDQVVPLLVGMFGDGDGLGTYYRAILLLEASDPEILAPALIEALESPHRGVRARAAEVACSVPHWSLIRRLVARLHDDDPDVQYWVAHTLLEARESADPRLATAAMREVSNTQWATVERLVSELD